MTGPGPSQFLFQDNKTCIFHNTPAWIILDGTACTNKQYWEDIVHKLSFPFTEADGFDMLI